MNATHRHPAAWSRGDFCPAILAVLRHDEAKADDELAGRLMHWFFWDPAYAAECVTAYRAAYGARPVAA